ARARVLRPRAVRDGVVLRVHVPRRVLRSRIGLALGLRDGGLDLDVQVGPYLRQLVLRHSGLAEVSTRARDRIPRHPLAHFVLAPIARVVVVGGMWLVAIALELDERRSAAP